MSRGPVSMDHEKLEDSYGWLLILGIVALCSSVVPLFPIEPGDGRHWGEAFELISIAASALFAANLLYILHLTNTSTIIERSAKRTAVLLMTLVGVTVYAALVLS